MSHTCSLTDLDERPASGLWPQGAPAQDFCVPWLAGAHEMTRGHLIGESAARAWLQRVLRMPA